MDIAPEAREWLSPPRDRGRHRQRLSRLAPSSNGCPLDPLRQSARPAAAGMNRGIGGAIFEDFPKRLTNARLTVDIER